LKGGGSRLRGLAHVPDRSARVPSSARVPGIAHPCPRAFICKNKNVYYSKRPYVMLHRTQALVSSFSSYRLPIFVVNHSANLYVWPGYKLSS